MGMSLALGFAARFRLGQYLRTSPRIFQTDRNLHRNRAAITPFKVPDMERIRLTVRSRETTRRRRQARDVWREVTGRRYDGRGQARRAARVAAARLLIHRPGGFRVEARSRCSKFLRSLPHARARGPGWAPGSPR